MKTTWKITGQVIVAVGGMAGVLVALAFAVSGILGALLLLWPEAIVLLLVGPFVLALALCVCVVFVKVLDELADQGWFR